MNFSTVKRHEIINNLTNETFDLLIIGGGITGAGIALDAASRGLKVALVEKQDFAQGTSSRSTKLVHGGLRYLEHLELALVREVGREREIVHNNASHIVIPEKMILPIIENGSLGEFTTSLALYVYDYLAGVKKEEHRKMLSREETVAKEPLIDSPILKGGALYYEYKTDDSRLTIEVMKKAVQYGALAINYAELKSFTYEGNNKITGGKILDRISNFEFEIKAKYVVNATGAWVDDLRRIDNSLKGKRLHLTKGIHIVIPKKRFPLQHAIYFDVGDNRMVFAIPRMDIVYVGTTDTDYNGEKENPDITRTDVQYLLDAVNRIAPSAKLTIDDVDSAWAGLRPLIHEEGKAPSELSRKDEVFFSDSGLISIAGGKLTGYRIMAKKVVDIVRKRFKDDEGRIVPKCVTKNIKLAGGEFDFKITMANLIDFADAKYDLAKQTGISVNDFKKLFYRYGNNIDKLIDKAYEYYNLTKNTKEAWLRAETFYTVNYEMVTSLTDFFIRRTGMIFFYINDIEPAIDIVADEAAKILSWTDEQKNLYINEIQNELKVARSFA